MMINTASINSGPQKSNLAGIQIMRGVAASVVVVHHIFREGMHTGSWQFTTLGNDLIQLGASGVDIFFVISGFIMAYVAREKFGKAGASKDFLLHRIVRVVPLYWIITSVYLIGWLVKVIFRHWDVVAQDIVCSYVFLPCVLPHGESATTHPLLDQGWTLSYEFYFYMIFAIWLAFGSMRSVILGVSAIFVAVLLIANNFPGEGGLKLFLSDTLVLEFCFGLVISHLYLKGLRISKPVSILLMFLGAIGLILTSLAHFENNLRFIFWGLPASLLVLGSLSISKLQSVIVGFFMRLGDMSYSLYLIHALIIMIIAKLFKYDAFRNAPVVLVSPLIYCACLFAGYFVYRFVEAPVTKKLQHFLAL